MLLYILVSITIILCIIILLLYYYFQKYKVQNSKIIETESNIDILLEKKSHILTKINKSIVKQIDNKTVDKLIKNMPKNQNLFELDKNLNNIEEQLRELIDDKNIVFDDENSDIIDILDSNNLELKAVKLYYNDCVIIYNNFSKKIFGLFLKIFNHFEKKELYVIEEIIPFEILKQKKEK